MTPAQADRIIAEGKPVTVHNPKYGETFTVTFVRRDRHSIYAQGGGVFDRADLQITNEKGPR